MRSAVSSCVSAAVVVFGLAGAPASAGPASSARGTAPEPADVVRGVAVQVKLVKSLGPDAANVSVSVAGDRAVLHGVVDRRATQELAEEVALSCEGIRHVDDRILERHPAKPLAHVAAEVRDAALEARVKNVLLGALGKPAMRIEVEATDGVVSLRGRFHDHETSRHAVETARGVHGVREVVDLLGA